MIIGIVIVFTCAMLGIIYWHKKINPSTTWLYGIYACMILTAFLCFVLMK